MTRRRWLGRAVRYLAGRPALLALVLASAALGSLAGIPVADVAFDYTWRDPRFCDDCHVHDYANHAYERSIHVGLTTCHDCHRVPIRHYPKNLYKMAFDRPEGRPDIHRPDVGTVVCSQCHVALEHREPLTGPMSEEVRRQVVKVDQSPLHALHMRSTTRDPGGYRGGDGAEGAVHPEVAAGEIPGEAAGRDPAADEVPVEGWREGVIECTDCHGAGPTQPHRFTAARENCLVCHEGVDAAVGRMSRLGCRECHFAGFVGTVPEPP